MAINMREQDNRIFKEPPEINLYRLAFGYIIQRLKWDLHPESCRSRRKLRGWKDKHFGDKAVIVCNGPSLLKTDFLLLKDIFTFGLNKINLLFEKTTFRPSCIVAVNPLVIEQNSEFYNQTSIPLFLNSSSIRFVERRDNIIFLHDTNVKRFARDCSLSIYQGYTVTFVAMQLAFHMGFRHIALIGCDHNYATKGPANKTVVSGEKDENHFDPNYFSRGMKWHLPDIFESEVSYNLARDVFQAYGGNIFNATEGGNLEIFPRIHLEEFLEKK